eukprot:GHVL01039299.1.p1 GENE.GHVL01039299.1~~GHVL01039299.1.p1  ORF type:complete len:595 (-),score=142.93 GHVL01039299.1:1364-3148(-)
MFKHQKFKSIYFQFFEFSSLVYEAHNLRNPHISLKFLKKIELSSLTSNEKSESAKLIFRNLGKSGGKWEKMSKEYIYLLQNGYVIEEVMSRLQKKMTPVDEDLLEDPRGVFMAIPIQIPNLMNQPCPGGVNPINILELQKKLKDRLPHSCTSFFQFMLKDSLSPLFYERGVPTSANEKLSYDVKVFERTDLREQSTVFSNIVSDKLFLLVLVNELENLKKSQKHIDSLGDETVRKELIESTIIPPTERQILDGFGIDVTKRRVISDKDLDHLKINHKPLVKNGLFVPRFPSFSVMTRIVQNLKLKNQLFDNYLAFVNFDDETVNKLPPRVMNSFINDPMGDPIYILFTAEMLAELTKYLLSACEAMSRAWYEGFGRATDVQVDSTGIPTFTVRILCGGVSASRLSYYLSKLFDKLLYIETDDNSVTVWEPFHVKIDVKSHLWSISDFKKNDETDDTYNYNGYCNGYFKYDFCDSLGKVLNEYKPNIVICTILPRGVDITDKIRNQTSVNEYILLGPKNTDQNGCYVRTWGGTWGVSGKSTNDALVTTTVTPWSHDGFIMYDIKEVSNKLLGSQDTPWAIGHNYASAFRRAHPVK